MQCTLGEARTLSGKSPLQAVYKGLQGVKKNKAREIFRHPARMLSAYFGVISIPGIPISSSYQVLISLSKALYRIVSVSDLLLFPLALQIEIG